MCGLGFGFEECLQEILQGIELVCDIYRSVKSIW